jgi:hypothetical protein
MLMNNAFNCEIAQDILDVINEPSRKAIVEELLSEDVASELGKRVNHTSDQVLLEQKLC